jgi:hypothetical protein
MQWPVFSTTSPSPPSPVVCRHHILGFLVSIIDRLAFNDGDAPAGMANQSCYHKKKLRRGLWSPEEDEKLMDHIAKYGHGCWSSVPKLAGAFFS